MGHGEFVHNIPCSRFPLMSSYDMHGGRGIGEAWLLLREPEQSRAQNLTDRWEPLPEDMVKVSRCFARSEW